MDRKTRWPEAIPLPDSKATTVAKAFLSGWICRYGRPDDVTSDRGSQFTGHLWKSICEILGIQARFTTAYHPQSNGMVERIHRDIKNGLRARLDGSGEWMDELPWVMYGLRSAINDETGTTPAEHLYGKNLTLPNQVFDPQPPPECATLAADGVEFVSNVQERVAFFNTPVRQRHNKSPHAITYVPPDLDTAKFVYLRTDKVTRPLTPKYEGPFLVVKRGPKTFQIVQKNRVKLVSIDRLRPAHQLALTPATDPPLPPPTPPADDMPAEHDQTTRLPAADTRQTGSEQVDDDNDNELSNELDLGNVDDFPPLPDPAPAPTAVTRRGRVIRPPKRYSD